MNNKKIHNVDATQSNNIDISKLGFKSRFEHILTNNNTNNIKNDTNSKTNNKKNTNSNTKNITNAKYNNDNYDNNIF
jgi:hypothetical protein